MISIMPLTSLFVTYCFHVPMQVYDVTQYLDDHPGGDDVILAATGTYYYLLVTIFLLHYRLHN